MSKIAILINDRQAEAIRMGSGITLLDDEVELFFIDAALETNDEVNMMMEIATEMELPVFSNVRNNTQENSQITLLSSQDINNKLLDYDHIIAY
ncbi:hypothetical protein MNBD_GAMMA07-418 [hydrothermal vent metagenome]|uniref:Uncharacterized protein n=1 Tax=hydrothermal vent metagenome TaxID=652676 RepID=A0A3B0WJU5_9ZZZZ